MQYQQYGFRAVAQATSSIGLRSRTSSSCVPRPSKPRWTTQSHQFHTANFLRAAAPSSSGSNTKLLDVIARRVQIFTEAEKNEIPLDDVEGQIAKSKTLKELEPLATAWKEHQATIEAIADSELLLDDSDPAMRSLAIEEISSLQAALDELELDTLPSLLLPPLATSSLGAILELKAGVGGDESALFVEQVMRMYIRYASERGWKVEILSKTPGSLGGTNSGLKDVTLEIKGDGPFGDMRFERGVHRVQRVPATESMGRVHTSTIAVVVLPVAEGKGEVSDDIVDEKDVKTEVMRARGAGGQHVNKTESAVRLTHIPTGISVSMQDSRSQHQNKAWAWAILRARLLDKRLAQQSEDRRATRRSQVKGMDRSDKIRTYNYPQDRVTDHRIGVTFSGLEGILEGEGLEYIVKELKSHHQGLRMESLLDSGEDLDE